MKIAILGNQQAGKSTAAKWLKDFLIKLGHPSSIVKFATPLYKSHDYLNSVVGKSTKNRGFLQDFSDVAKKHFGDDIFVKAFLKGTKDTNINLICDDVRYVREVEALKKDGWIVIYLYADENIRKLRSAIKNVDFMPNHSSEIEVAKCDHLADYFFPNNTDPEDLYEMLYGFMCDKLGVEEDADL